MAKKAKPIALKDSGVVFNKKDHTYFIGDKQLSGITGMLTRQLTPNEFDDVNPAVLAAAADYGTSVHDALEDFDKNWIDNGMQEVKDYADLCKQYGFVHEDSEYSVTDGEHWASNIDKVFRVDDNTFTLADIKTYGTMDETRLQKARWQLSIYAYLFQLVNPKAEIKDLAIIRVRHKETRNGNISHAAEVTFVKRIPVDTVKQLLDADVRGEQFVNPLAIPNEIASKEERIRELTQQKSAIEEELAAIKLEIYQQMLASDVKVWETNSMRITRRSDSTRISFDSKRLQSEHPEIDYTPYIVSTQVAGSVTISL